MAANKRQQQRPFHRREVRPHAGQRPRAERQIGAPGTRPFAAQPSLRPKSLGVALEGRVPVQVVRADEEDGAGGGTDSPPIRLLLSCAILRDARGNLAAALADAWRRCQYANEHTALANHCQRS